MDMTDSPSIWKQWNASDTILLFIIIILFVLNITFLVLIYVKLNRKIDAHVCQKCTEEPESKQMPPESFPIRESSLGITPMMQAEDDSDSTSSEGSDYSDSGEKQKLSKQKTKVTYTTVHFDNKKQLPDYENIVETPDYVNVDIKGSEGKKKKLKKKVESVDYTIIVPVSVPFKRTSHPPAKPTDSCSS